MIDEKRIIQALENALVNAVNKGEAFTIAYQNRTDISPQLNEAFKRINFERVIDLVVARMEEELAEKMVNKIITEMGTDIKKLMENNSTREDFRFLLRKGVEEILGRVKKQEEGK